MRQVFALVACLATQPAHNRDHSSYYQADPKPEVPYNRGNKTLVRDGSRNRAQKTCYLGNQGRSAAFCLQLSN